MQIKWFCPIQSACHSGFHPQLFMPESPHFNPEIPVSAPKRRNRNDKLCKISKPSDKFQPNFGKTMQTKKIPENIDDYIAGFPTEIQARLQTLRALIKTEAPAAEEAIRYQIPTFVLHGNLVHFAGLPQARWFLPGAGRHRSV
jgi:hypothetical protein